MVCYVLWICVLCGLCRFGGFGNLLCFMWCLSVEVVRIFGCGLVGSIVG